MEHWLFTWVFFFFLVSTSPFGGSERGRRDWSRVGTLLGPEEAGALALILWIGTAPSGADALLRSRCRPYLENCTVDASI